MRLQTDLANRVTDLAPGAAELANIPGRLERLPMSSYQRKSSPLSQPHGSLIKSTSLC